MANLAAADRKVGDLLRFVGKPEGTGAITRGAGRLLRERPSKTSLIRLAGAMDAWEHALRAEGAATRNPETLVEVRTLNTLLTAAIDATPDTLDDTVADQILRVLTEVGRAQPSEIADTLGKGRPHVTKVLKSMTSDGLVEIDDDVTERDGRKVFYRPIAVHG